ncbi:MAG TPA: hypothetical protein VGB98_20205 [Pyrinomonadaceae bacterium]
MNEQTRETARGLGRAVVEALRERGAEASAVVRGYEADTIEAVRQLPASSARLGIIFKGDAPQQAAQEHAQFIGAKFCRVVHVGGSVVVCEVTETGEEGGR